MHKLTAIALITSGLVLAGLPTAACRAEPVQPPAVEATPGLPFSAFLSEDEMRMLFDFMRDAIIAAMKGEEASMPPELAFKLAILEQRLIKEGNAAVQGLMLLLQQEIDKALKQPPPPPPPQPERTGT